VPAPRPQDDLSFSANPKMLGERNPDSVLFNVRELHEPSAEDAAPPAARAGSKSGSPRVAAAVRPAPEEGERSPGSSGLIDVKTLIDEEEAANATPPTSLAASLVPPTAVPEASSEPISMEVPSARMPMFMLLAGVAAIIVALVAVVVASR
jgi:hypothetical protein